MSPSLHRSASCSRLALLLLFAACGGGVPSTDAPAATGAGQAPASAAPDIAQQYGPDVLANLERVRAVTDRYHDIAAAHADGYPTAVPRCIENQPAGGMGLHYMHQALLDDRLEVEKPEILVYAPNADGSARLAGVEYVVPLSAWSAQEPPRIFGQPLKRSEPLGIWYLHVWAWEENRNGLFADWNPTVSC